MDAPPGLIGPDSAVQFGMFGMLLLALLLVILFVVYQQRIIRQQRIHRQKEAAHQQALLRASLQSQENERNRIGKDLHDDVGVLLTTAKMYLGHLDPGLESGRYSELKEKTAQILGNSLSSVRRVSQDLRPVVLERLGLVEAVNNLVEYLEFTGDVSVSFRHEVKRTIDPEYALHWYRIIQELITNTLKHARATSIDLELMGNNEEVTLRYRDNGIGLPSGASDFSGLGMKNIESRVSLMRGTSRITELDQGFDIQLTGKYITP
ncbi:MAG: hypothetical protein F6K11_10945 [Leptolyngbya sp. SIO3F4]|nr:hypothetical protein [Leptolyngbya sp. SIO3F4]